MNVEFLKTLLSTVSVSGNEEANQENALRYAKEFAERQEVDAVGNAISAYHCEAPFRVLLSGHIDEIGFRVTQIDDRGFLHVQKAGGVNPALYLGAPMQVIHEAQEDGKTVRRKLEGVGVLQNDLLKKEKLEATDLLIDLGAKSKEEAEALVSVGDSVCADTSFHELLNGNFSSRALDDKTGAFVILEAAKLAKEKGAACGVFAHTCVGEETSGRGAYFAGANLAPDCAIIVDVTWASDCPGTDPAETGRVALGEGPVLCRSGMVNKKMNALLEAIAQEKGIPLQYEIAGGRTYTDGDTILTTGRGVPVALVSIPLRYMHSSAEIGNFRDLENAIELIAEFLLRIGEGFDFRPLIP